jgi:thiamine pyrophosphate-dependent acetolactate synthase large subunit-like protein
MNHTLSTKLQEATIELSMGLYTVNFHADSVLDLNHVKRVEEARRELVSGGEGPVLVVIPKNVALVEQEALAWMGSLEAMEGVAARAIVVPSSIQVLRDRIRWALFKPAIPFRVFRNPQVAKGWVLDTWYDNQIGQEVDTFVGLETDDV